MFFPIGWHGHCVRPAEHYRRGRVANVWRAVRRNPRERRTMKYNAWTLALISAGVVSLPAVAHAEESTNVVLTAISTTTISGYVDTSAHWNPGTGNLNLPTYSPNGVAGGRKADGFNLDVVALTISKPVGEGDWVNRSEEHTSELQSRQYL